VVSDSRICDKQQDSCNNKDIAFHGRELRMVMDIRRKEKMEKAIEFAEKMKKK